MIVRNEAAILGRCLDSVSGLIDSWVICDTGSDDGTPELIERLLADLPGELHRTEWVDFGHNRTRLMELARGSADYLLLLDADMTLARRAALPPLDADGYMLREAGGLDFGILRLVRGDRRWWYVGSTHEYIATDGRFDQRQLDELVTEHHGDGSSRWEKLVRDIGLLKRDLADDPEDARAVFYLAQTYRDMGKREIAADYYRRRVEMGGWEEEVFYANLQAGITRAESDADGALAILLEAWQRRPTRAEPLYELARIHRPRGDFAVAHLFASRGLEIPYPSDDVLFVHRWVYEWGLRLERGQAAAGLGRFEEAEADLRELLERELPPHVEDYVQEALEGVLDRRSATTRMADGTEVPRLAAIAPSARIGQIKVEVKPDWPPFNPSVTADGESLRMIVRTANYRIEAGVLHDEGILVTINYLVTLDGTLSVTGIEAIADRSEGGRRYSADIQGYEDCRLIECAGRWFATATVCDLNPIDRREMVLLEFDGADIVSIKRLASPDPRRHEKNWMPFVIDGVLHLVYGCSPTVILRCDPDTGKIEEVANTPGPPEATRFRGGSQGVQVDGGYLFVIHEVDRTELAARYVHRFVLLGDDLTIGGISRPFSFVHDRIEFCAGMARLGGELVLSFGVSDAAAGLATVDLTDVLALICPAGTPSTQTIAGHAR